MPLRAIVVTLTSLLCQGVMMNSATLNRKMRMVNSLNMQYIQHTIHVDAECIVERKRKHRPDNDIDSSGRSQYMAYVQHRCDIAFI